MSKASEIKCPVCEKWSNWTGKVDEKCPNCGAQLDPVSFKHAEDVKINTQKAQSARYLVVKDTDDTIVQMGKQFVNWLKWASFYGLSGVYVFIAFMIIVFGLIMLV